MTTAAKPTTTTSETRVVVILALGFGLVGVDRFLIATLFPVIAEDLNLSYGDIGTITGVLALAWGFAALVMGNLADRIGRRLVLTGSLTVFALLIGASGLAVGLAGLLVVRIVMGFADGAFTPASIAATVEASAPHRRGRNVGLQQAMLPLFGLGLSPLIVAELLHVVDWRWIFVIFTPPGLLLAWLTWRFLPAAERPVRVRGHRHLEQSLADLRTVIRHRNVPIAMALMFCWLTCLITTSALLPSYLVDHLKLPLSVMGRIMSAIGIGGMLGTLILTALSDRIGRKTVILLCGAGSLGALLMLQATGADSWQLFAWLFLVHFFNNAAIALTVGPVSTEAVPPTLIATASGMVVAAGELLGGGLAPMLAGQVADMFGIQHILLLPVGGVALGLALAMMLSQPVHPTESERIDT